MMAFRTFRIAFVCVASMLLAACGGGGGGGGGGSSAGKAPATLIPGDNGGAANDNELQSGNECVVTIPYVEDDNLKLAFSVRFTCITTRDGDPAGKVTDCVLNVKGPNVEESHDGGTGDWFNNGFNMGDVMQILNFKASSPAPFYVQVRIEALKITEQETDEANKRLKRLVGNPVGGYINVSCRKTNNNVQTISLPETIEVEIEYSYP